MPDQPEQANVGMCMASDPPSSMRLLSGSFKQRRNQHRLQKKHVSQPDPILGISPTYQYAQEKGNLETSSEETSSSDKENATGHNDENTSFGTAPRKDSEDNEVSQCMIDTSILLGKGEAATEKRKLRVETGGHTEACEEPLDAPPTREIDVKNSSNPESAPPTPSTLALTATRSFASSTMDPDSKETIISEHDEPWDEHEGITGSSNQQSDAPSSREDETPLIQLESKESLSEKSIFLAEIDLKNPTAQVKLKQKDQPRREGYLPSSVVSVPLVGHKAPLAKLKQAVLRANAKGLRSAGSSVHVYGPGRASLVEAMKQQNQQSKTIFAIARCEPRGEWVIHPFAPVLDLIHQVVTQIISHHSDWWQSQFVKSPHLRRVFARLAHVDPSIRMLIPRASFSTTPGVNISESTECGFCHMASTLTILWESFSQCQSLVLVLHDLQWAHKELIVLLKQLMQGTNGNRLRRILWIGTTKTATLPHGLAFQMTIPLRPLDSEEVLDIVVSSLGNDFDEMEVMAFAEDLYKETKGNPCCIVSFLKILYHRRLIVYNRNSQRWVWKISEIRSKLQLASNPEELAMEQITGERNLGTVLPVLVLAAFFGTRTINARVFMQVFGTTDGDHMNNSDEEFIPSHLIPPMDSLHELEGILMAAVQDGLMEQVPHKKRVYRFAETQTWHSLRNVFMRTTPPALIPKLHYHIGKRLCAFYELQERVSGVSPSEDLLQIVLFHLNRSLPEIMPRQAESQELVRLNIEAGCMAMSRWAYTAATEWFEVARAILVSRVSSNDSKTLSQLSAFQAQCQSLAGDDFGAIETVRESIGCANAALCNVIVSRLIVDYYLRRGQFAKATGQTMKMLDQLGCPFPRKKFKIHLQSQLRSLARTLVLTTNAQWLALARFDATCGNEPATMRDQFVHELLFRLAEIAAQSGTHSLRLQAIIEGVSKVLETGGAQICVGCHRLWRCTPDQGWRHRGSW